jgi:hypothetical protein
MVYFMTIDNAKFRKPVVPGDRLEYHVTKIKQRGNIWRFHCEAMVDGAKAAEADIGAMLAPGESETDDIPCACCPSSGPHSSYRTRRGWGATGHQC